MLTKIGYEPLRSRGGGPDLSGSITKKQFFMCVFPYRDHKTSLYINSQITYVHTFRSVDNAHCDN